MNFFSMSLYTWSLLVWTGWWPWPGANSTSGIPVTASGLDCDQANAAIGLVTGQTASIVGRRQSSVSLVAGEVWGMACRLPCLTPHTNIRIIGSMLVMSRLNQKQRKWTVSLSADITADSQRQRVLQKLPDHLEVIIQKTIQGQSLSCCNYWGFQESLNQSLAELGINAFKHIITNMITPEVISRLQDLQQTVCSCPQGQCTHHALRLSAQYRRLWSYLSDDGRRTQAWSQYHSTIHTRWAACL